MKPWEKYASAVPPLKPWEKYAAMPAGFPAIQQNDTPAKAPHFLEQAGHQLGLTGRTVASSIGGSLGLIGDPLNAAINAVTGNHLPAVSHTIQAGINQLFPQPQNATERVVNNASTILAGMGSGSGLARGLSALFQPAAKTATQAVLGQLGQLTKTDLASTAAGGLAAGAAGESGAPPLVQAALGLVPNFALPMAIAPKAATNPHVQTLLKEGVTPTPGQLFGGFPRKIEDKATAVPIAGDFIEQARERANDAFNRAVHARTLAPLGEKSIKAVGRKGYEYTEKTLNGRYNQLLPKLTFKADTTLTHDLSRIEQEAAKKLPEAEEKHFWKMMHPIRDKLDLLAKAKKEEKGAIYKNMESELTGEANELLHDSSLDKRKLGRALSQVKGALHATLKRSNPRHAEALTAINRGWANLVTLREAASAQGDQVGIFSPGQLAAAVRKLDHSTGHGAYARGHARMQDLSDAGVAVLGRETAPATKTAHKFLDNLGLLGTAAGLGYFGPSALFVPAGISALYTPPVTKGLAALFAKRPPWAQGAAQELRNAAPLASWAIAPNVYATTKQRTNYAEN